MDTLTPVQKAIARSAYVTGDGESVMILVKDGAGPADGSAAAKFRLGTNNIELRSVQAINSVVYAVYSKV